MDTTTLVQTVVTLLAPALPYLMKAGDAAATEAATRLGTAAWDKAKALWSRLRPRIEAREAAREAAVDVANQPQDADAQGALRLQLKKLLEADQALTAELSALVRPGTGQGSIDTGGGAYVGGSVKVGDSGNFVGRDQTVFGDQVRGDRITTGDISGNVGAIGRSKGPVTVTQTQDVSGDELSRLFAQIYQRIDTRQPDSDVDTDELKAEVQKIENEVKQGDQANPNKVKRWLLNLASMAPDIFDVTVATLASPMAGIATVVQKIAQKAREEAGRV